MAAYRVSAFDLRASGTRRGTSASLLARSFFRLFARLQGLLVLTAGDLGDLGVLGVGVFVVLGVLGILGV